MIFAAGMFIAVLGLVSTHVADRRRNWRAVDRAWTVTLFGAALMLLSLGIIAFKELP